jgi:hypothetical protein
MGALSKTRHEGGPKRSKRARMLEAVITTDIVSHQPEAQHPKIFSYPQAGPADYPIFWQISRKSSDPENLAEVGFLDVYAAVWLFSAATEVSGRFCVK